MKADKLLTILKKSNTYIKKPIVGHQNKFYSENHRKNMESECVCFGPSKKIGN